jgi:hypothetical protein
MAFVFLMPLLFQAATATPPAQPAPQQLAANETNATKAEDPSKKVICKREPRTGSLAGTERICRTKAQWQALSDRTRDEWQEIQGAKGSSHGG